jgi:hypothetical protein
MTDLARLARPGAPAFRVAAFATFTLLAGCNGNELTNASNTATDSLAAPAQLDAASASVKAQGPQRNRLTRVTVSPNTGSVASGAAVAYKAMGTTSDGSQVSVPVKWTATGGTIDSTGYFRAGTAPGRFQVVGSEPTSGLKDTAVVTVSASTLATITATGTCAAVGGGRQVNVATASALRAALSGAKPGDAIRLADGVYTGEFIFQVSGTAQAPISLCGSRQAVLDGVTLGTGLTVQLKASYWRLHGFTITRGQKGVYMRGGHYNVLDSLWVHDVGMEAIHLLEASTHNTVQWNLVERTGRYNGSYGEGIYTGNGSTGADRTNYNQILHNTIRDVASEGIDVKEGTTGQSVQFNTISNAGTARVIGNDAGMGIRGDSAQVLDNSITTTPRYAVQVYIGTASTVATRGRGNRFQRNRIANVGGGARAFYVMPAYLPYTAVYCDNTVSGTTLGVTCIR